MMKLYKERLLSDAQLKRLGEHQYSCQSVSILDKLLQPYWNWLTSKVPIWLAPNLITILGLIVNIVTALILIWFSPDAKQEAPRWACGLCGFGLFVYQSLDAIDGKQARRTGTANPLGELFDHGCDSISTVFVALSACIAVQLGYYPGWMFFQCFCAMTLFYCAHWQTYVSGTLRFGRIDVTEAQYTIMGILLLSTIFGPSVWSTKFFSGTVCLWYLIPLSTLICGLWSLYQSIIVIFTGGVGKNGSTVAVFGFTFHWAHVVCTVFYLGFFQLFYTFFERIKEGGCGKNGSTVAGTSVLSPVIPFSMVLVPAFIIYQKSTQHVYEEHPALYILAFGLVAAKVTNRLVVAHMTKSEMDYMDWSLLGPTMLFLNQYFNTFIKEYYILWLCMIWVIVDLLRYCYQICQEICDFLHVELFRIPYPGGPQRVVTLPSEKNGKSEKKIHLSDGEDVVPLLQSEENS
ncbi:cholinephosphotransferase 1 isoform X1 [Tribolium castaneum]|uniref:cholinephosphotransferase 1 isoform X1 n=1 Tax=Tribolium castaneum TaxID=7070 RepID=UPI00046C2B54|nr:PREDICTED: cholinephosphotransferase 1 isoform X1 [Tribolium castaneum]|eukprot:XP_008192558.1 PREDICTED: cholinephosphotransferase 1 isoform X1 [Tribolium castaneum]